MKKLEYKNPTNWLIAIALPIPILIFIIATIVLLFSVIFSEDIFSKINYALILLPLLTFVVFFLWVWLWNTFGKTIIIFNNNEISVKKKFNIFYKKKIYLKNSISKIFIEDRSIEKTKSYVRINSLFSNKNQSIVLDINDGRIISIIDWLNYEKAEIFKKQFEKYLQ